MRRLIDARISFESDRNPWRYLHMDVSSSAEFWWDSNKSEQANLWESWIELGEIAEADVALCRERRSLVADTDWSGLGRHREAASMTRWSCDDDLAIH